MTSAFRYAPAALCARYARGALGLALTLGPAALLQPAPWLGVVLYAGAILFVLDIAGSLVSHLTCVMVDETGVRTRGPFAVAVDWSDMRSLQLDYYSTRRDRSHGWMQLAIRGSRGCIRIESAHQGFTPVAHSAAREAMRRGCAMDPRTRSNLAAIGIATADPPLPAYSGARHG